MAKFRFAALPLFLILLAAVQIHAQDVPDPDLTLTSEDLLLELRPDGGFHLFIRYRPDISSVLITETTRDPEFREANFAYRAPEWNAVNGDEIRIIDGSPLPRDRGIYSLVSSTPEWHPVLGWAFHIYIPTTILYGNEGGRNGEVQVGNGTYLNIRAFYYARADYRGPFSDNPFMISVTQELTHPATEVVFMRETAETFLDLAGYENTSFLASPAEMMEQIRAVIRTGTGGSADIVIALDVTASMVPFFDEIRRRLVPAMREMAAGFDSVRVGMVFYKDYYDDFLTKPVPFTSDFDELQRGINGIRVSGGVDIPEAVYEALHAGATQFQWESEKRLMILIGDAPPHPRPRGKITKQMAEEEMARQHIELHSIVLPHP